MTKRRNYYERIILPRVQKTNPDHTQVEVEVENGANTRARKHINVTMTNYNKFDVLPCVTETLAPFLDAKKGCRYCQQLNVPAAHTMEWLL